MPHQADKRLTAGPRVVRLSAPPEIQNLDAGFDLSVFPAESFPASSDVVTPLRARQRSAPPLPVRRQRPMRASRVLAVVIAGVVLGSSWLWSNLTLPVLREGRVRIESTPPGAPIFVDEVYRGDTPSVVPLSLGTHMVSVGGGESGTDAFPVIVQRGVQVYRVRLATPIAAATPAITQPQEDVAQLPVVTEVPVRSAIEEPASIRPVVDRRDARVAPPAPRPAAAPSGFGFVDINAQPWAAVSIDGVAIGETPLGGVRLSAGPHEVTFTHPDLGQRRDRIVVITGERTRLAVDLRAK